MYHIFAIFSNNNCFESREGVYALICVKLLFVTFIHLLSLLQYLLNESSDLAKKLGEKSSGTVFCPAMENLCPEYKLYKYDMFDRLVLV